MWVLLICLLVQFSSALLLGPVARTLAVIASSTLIDLSPATVGSLEQVARVRYSLDSVVDTINSSGEPGLVVSQIKSLLTNYRLRENCEIVAESVVEGRRIDARTHARAAVEDLVQIYEYFPDDIDNREPSINNLCKPLRFRNIIYYQNPGRSVLLARFCSLRRRLSLLRKRSWSICFARCLMKFPPQSLAGSPMSSSRYLNWNEVLFVCVLSN
jgi:hypothetical protein